MAERRGRKELVELDRTLAAVEDITPKLRADLVDLEESAWSQSVGEQQERRGRKQGWALTDVGDPRAKLALRELDQAAAAYLAAARKTTNLFLGGPGANSALRGTLLGSEDGSGAEAEHRRLLDAQNRRRGRGEYVPTATERQPPVPGGRHR